jgi:hypothetical protein
VSSDASTLDEPSTTLPSIPRPHLDEHAGSQGLDRDRAYLPVVDASRRGRRQGEQQLRRVGGDALASLLHVAPDQQQEDQRGDRVEVDLPRPAQRVERPPTEPADDAERDRHVHVETPGAQRAEGAAIERPGRPQHRR